MMLAAHPRTMYDGGSKYYIDQNRGLILTTRVWLNDDGTLYSGWAPSQQQGKC